MHCAKSLKKSISQHSQSNQNWIIKTKKNKETTTIFSSHHTCTHAALVSLHCQNTACNTISILHGGRFYLKYLYGCHWCHCKPVWAIKCTSFARQWDVPRHAAGGGAGAVDQNGYQHTQANLNMIQMVFIHKNKHSKTQDTQYCAKISTKWFGGKHNGGGGGNPQWHTTEFTMQFMQRRVCV